MLCTNVQTTCKTYILIVPLFYGTHIILLALLFMYLRDFLAPQFSENSCSFSQCSLHYPLVLWDSLKYNISH